MITDKRNIHSLEFDIGQSVSKPIDSYIYQLLKNNSCKATQEILLNSKLSNQQKKEIHTFWTEKGHRVRDKLKDDIRLENLLKKCLPKYDGKSISLYRGENIKRFNNRQIGFCWTSKLDIAEMFARGINAVKSGGVVICYEFKPEEIISAPSKHSRYLGEYEYTICPSMIDYSKITTL